MTIERKASKGVLVENFWYLYLKTKLVLQGFKQNYNLVKTEKMMKKSSRCEHAAEDHASRRAHSALGTPGELFSSNYDLKPGFSGSLHPV